MRLSRNTPAKINLYLDVVGKRDDGYHEIQTLFLPLAAPADTIAVTELAQTGLELHCEHPAVPDGEGNLCRKAATAFAVAAGCEPRWHIVIEKRIPVAAGMGGGSADAAAVLQMLDELQKNVLPAERLHEIAAQLGADVPFFLNPVPALANGIGDVLRPLAVCISLPLVLVSPGFPITAAWAYANLDRTKRPHPPSLERLQQALAAGDRDTIADCAWNALEFAAYDKFPMLEMIRELLLSKGCTAAHVTGSGPAVFGLCSVEDQARIARDVRTYFGQNVEVFETTTLSAAPL